MSTCIDSDHDRLTIRLTDFGLARDLSGLDERPDVDEFTDISLRIEAEANGIIWPSGVLNWAKGEDSYALGLTLAELFFSALSQGGPNERTSRSGMQRLFHDLFQCDMSAAREFCAEDEDWKYAVEFLDLEGGQGWAMIGELLSCQSNLEDLISRYSAFLNSGEEV